MIQYFWTLCTNSIFSINERIIWHTKQVLTAPSGIKREEARFLSSIKEFILETKIPNRNRAPIARMDLAHNKVPLYLSTASILLTLNAPKNLVISPVTIHCNASFQRVTESIISVNKEYVTESSCHENFGLYLVSAQKFDQISSGKSLKDYGRHKMDIQEIVQHKKLPTALSHCRPPNTPSPHCHVDAQLSGVQIASLPNLFGPDTITDDKSTLDTLSTNHSIVIMIVGTQTRQVDCLNAL